MEKSHIGDLGNPNKELEERFKNIPNRMAFKIGEVAKILNIRPSILRFWETEFKELNPPKSRSRQRAYRHRDIKVALVIKKLLYEDRFSIEGAKAVLKTEVSKSFIHNSKESSFGDDPLSFIDFQEADKKLVDSYDKNQKSNGDHLENLAPLLPLKKTENFDKETLIKKLKTLKWNISQLKDFFQ